MNTTKKYLNKVKNTSRILLALVLYVSLTPLYAEINLKVSGIKSSHGNILIGIFTSQENFDQKIAHREYKVGATSKSVTLNMEDLEPGQYMIAVYHDVNSNMILDRFIVIPTEDYGFSNNARGFMGPPSFEKASFRYDEKPVKMEIHL